MIITTTTGKEIVPGSETRVSALFIPSRQFPGKATPLFQKAKELAPPGSPKMVSSSGNPTFVTARNGLKPELVGQWATQRYNVLEGMLIAVSVIKLLRGIQTTGAVLLQVRDGAPLVRIQVPLSGHQDAAYSMINIEGRFDVADAELAANEGANFTGAQQLIRQFVPSARDRLMTVTQLAGETRARPRIKTARVATDAGEVVEVAIEKKKRQLDI